VHDETKTKAQLIQELEGMRCRVAELETKMAARTKVVGDDTKFLETLLDIIPVPVFYKDAEGTYLGCNTAFAEQILGLPKEEVIGRSLYDLPDVIPTELADVYHQQDRALLKAPGTQIYEAPVRCADGVRRRFVFHKATFANSTSEAIGIIGVMLDVTERECAQQALRESESRCQTLFDNAGDAIFIHGLMPDPRFLRVNQVACDRLGYRREELLQMTPMDIDASEYRDLVPERMRILQEKGHILIETVHVSRDGTRIPIELNSRVIEYGGEPAVLSIARDITKRKRAERALEQSRERFRMVSTLTSDFAYEIRVEADSKLTLEWATEAIVVTLGYTVEEINRQRGWHELIHPDDIPKVMHHLKLCLANQADVSEYRVLSREGEVRWLRSYIQPIWDSQAERVAYFYGAAQDITERKQIEAALQESQENLAALINNTQDMIWSVDENLRLTVMNAAFKARVKLLSGLSPRIGQNISVYLPPDLKEEWLALYHRALNGESFTVERHYDVGILPEPKDVEISFDPIMGEGDRVRGVGVFSRDITTRKRAEQAQAFLASIVASSDDAIIGKGLDGTILSWNRGAEHIYGYPEEEVVGSSISVIIPPDRADEFSQILEHIKRGESVENYETVRVREDGVLIDVSLTVSPIEDTVGQITGASTIARDITARKRDEAALARYAEELARSNEELERFIYIASHHLQEPLRMVSTYTQWLARRYEGQLDAMADEFIAYAVDGATYMSQLLRDLLLYSKVDRRAMVDDRLKLTSCEGVVNSVLRQLRPVIENSHATVTYDALPELPADTEQLGLVFKNLISNALKFHGAEPPRIHIGAQEQDGAWLFSIRDNGIGIEPRHTTRIFRLFERLHTRDQYPGTGVGLAICKRIIERHGGRIWVESEPGVGSTFFFTLPES
jgi:PAS domain S-box-containing protein